MSALDTGAPSEASRHVAVGSLVGLALLKAVMLAGLFSRTPPHPPLELAPLFGASLALSALCVALILARSRWFWLPALAVVAESLLSFGPQKLYPGEGPFFAQSAAVYPAIVAGTALVATLAASGWRLLARGSAGGAPARG